METKILFSFFLLTFFLLDPLSFFFLVKQKITHKKGKIYKIKLEIKRQQ